MIKSRKTKQATVQVRIEEDVKAVLQQYADAFGITLSALMRLTLANLAAEIRK
jgi:antitoxin component of RelBE/YafQ-DinJ toxin-antitoxin module